MASVVLPSEPAQVMGKPFQLFFRSFFSLTPIWSTGVLLIAILRRFRMFSASKHGWILEQWMRISSGLSANSCILIGLVVSIIVGCTHFISNLWQVLTILYMWSEHKRFYLIHLLSQLNDSTGLLLSHRFSLSPCKVPCTHQPSILPIITWLTSKGTTPDSGIWLGMSCMLLPCPRKPKDHLIDPICSIVSYSLTNLKCLFLVPSVYNFSSPW